MKIAPDLAASLLAQIPARLVKKLDADPAMAKKWTWRGNVVETDKGERVTLELDGEVVRGVACSCLLSPKCLHVAAVVSSLEPEEEGPRTSDLGPRPEGSEPEARGPRPEARSAFATCAEILATGGDASGAFQQTELLRSIHACRTAGLHRLAAAQTRLLRSIRDLRADKP